MQSVRVWDLPTRFGHWLLALLVIVAIVTSEEKGLLHTIHIVCGIGAGVIVLFRLVWASLATSGRGLPISFTAGPGSGPMRSICCG